MTRHALGAVVGLLACRSEPPPAAPPPPPPTIALDAAVAIDAPRAIRAPDRTTSLPCPANIRAPIYVATARAELRGFDPSRLPGDPFTPLGAPSCLHAPPMALVADADGGYVADRDGAVYAVHTTPPRCTPLRALDRDGARVAPPFTLTERVGTRHDESRLATVIGARLDLEGLELATLDPSSGAWAPQARVAVHARLPPALASTGAHDLFVLLADDRGARVRELVDFTTLATGAWELPPPPDGATITAWSLAYTHGAFYAFAATADGDTWIYRLDPDRGVAEAVQLVRHVEVVAAASTCLPSPR